MYMYIKAYLLVFNFLYSHRFFAWYWYCDEKLHFDADLSWLARGVSGDKRPVNCSSIVEESINLRIFRGARKS